MIAASARRDGLVKGVPDLDAKLSPAHRLEPLRDASSPEERQHHPPRESIEGSQWQVRTCIASM